MYPYNFKMGQRIQTNVPGFSVDRFFGAHIVILAAAAVLGAIDSALEAVQDTEEEQIISEGIINPLTPRNITATAGGTAGDIKAIQIVVEGTNFADEEISETLPAFTVDTAGTVTGNKAFKTITSITIPAHDGTGATTSIGFGSKLGLPYLLEHNTVDFAFLDHVKEATAPTVTVDEEDIENNTISLNSALDGSQVDIYLKV